MYVVVLAFCSCSFSDALIRVINACEQNILMCAVMLRSRAENKAAEFHYIESTEVHGCYKNKTYSEGERVQSPTEKYCTYSDMEIEHRRRDTITGGRLCCGPTGYMAP